MVSVDTQALDASLVRLGGAIRARRKQNGMTLVQLASEAGLSHSFLSQVERGLGRLSMSSLYRVAQALGTTQQDLLSAWPTPHTQASQPSVDDAVPEGVTVFSVADGTSATSGSAAVHVFAQPDSSFVPMYYDGIVNTTEWWEHDEDEFLFVISGSLIVEVGEMTRELHAGEACAYRGGIRHRWSSANAQPCQFLSVKQRQASAASHG